MTEESIVDDELHLVAAMQFCGFRSVVRTMGAMAATDGQGLASDFYRSVFSDRTQGARGHYERTEEALRDAVVKLQRKRDDLGTFGQIMFITVHDSVLSVRDQVCLGYHLTDDFGALGDLHPLWGAIGCMSG
jgi:hypothetical protein